MNIRTSLVLLIALALVAGWVYFYELRLSPELEEKAPWFYLTELREITAVSVTDQGERRGYFLDDADQQWHFDDEEQLPVDEDKWGGKVLLLSGPRSRILLEEDATPEQLAEWGLQSPVTTATVSLTEARQVIVLMGDDTVDGSGTYAQLEGFPQVYLIANLWRQEIAKLVTDPPYPGWLLRTDPENVVELRLLYRGTEVEFEKDEDGWHFDDEDRTPVDPTRWEAILPLLSGPSRIPIVEQEVEDFSAYGITQDSTQITVLFEDAEAGRVVVPDIISYVIGDQAPDGDGYYARASGFDQLLLLETAWIDPLTSLAEDPPYPEPQAGPDLT